LVVIDDGSTDNSVKVIERMLRECPFDSEFVSRENRGICATLNQGFRMTTGEYFAYLGSDDIWLQSFLQEQENLLAARPDALLAFSHAYVIDDEDQIVARTDEWSRFADGDLLPTLLAGEIFSSPGVLYRRSAIEGREWNERAGLEDYELYLRLAAAGEVARNEKVLCAWRRHAHNTSRDTMKMLDEQLAAQRSVAADIGLSNEQIARGEGKLRLRAAEELLRQGDRRAAAGVFLDAAARGLRLSSMFRMLLRLAVPDGIFRWNRERKLRDARKRHGRLQT
jgi:alpha-1,3-rhamnosyltransferase